MKKTVQKKYWYKHYITFCPVCGRGKTEKYRVYGKKPSDYGLRVETQEVYDWCNE